MKNISLSGVWSIFYSVYKPESDTALPDFSNAFETEAVPGYWEDMYEGLREAEFFDSIVLNPEYETLEYPIIRPLTGSVPDMSLETVVGTFWYRREAEIPFDAADKYIGFKCAGVQNRALLWVNGFYVGEHRGYSAPFELDVSEYVKPGEKNAFVMAVSNHQAYNENGDAVSGCTSRAANRFTGGVMGDISLEIHNRTRVSSAYVAEYNVKDDSFDVVVDVVCDGEYQLKWQIIDGKRGCVECGTAFSAEFTVPRNNLELWSPKHPKLYTLLVTVVSEGCLCDTYSAEFGIRALESRGTKLYLNNEPVYLRGICEHGYFPMTVHPTNDIEYYTKVINRLKELDFNFIRFHTWIPVEEYMCAADRLGMLLHVECPNNTTEAEWKNIMYFVRRHPSVVIACMGNEMFVGEEEIERFRRCAEVTHKIARGINFSPMSAIRGVEYFYTRDDHSGVCNTPFEHHPERFKKLKEFCDLFSSYPLGHLSYLSLTGSPKEIDSWASIYEKPRLAHEICILGTYPDITLEKRYKNSRIGKIELFSGPRKMLEELNLIHRAGIYYKNSCMWQALHRKQIFENARLAKTFAGYDFLGDIDHHWHTSGYRVGLMNEFYELKPGVTVENVRQYNGENVLLSSLNTSRAYLEDTKLSIDFSASVFGGEDIDAKTLRIKAVSLDGSFYEEGEFTVSAPNGEVTWLAAFELELPKTSRPTKIDITAELDNFNNTWDIWVFPDAPELETSYITTRELTDGVIEKLENGADVLMLGTKGLYKNDVEFRIAYPGRMAGNLATVIENHPLTNALDHDGFCSWQFKTLMTGATALYYQPSTTVPFEPIIDVASSYKWIRRGSALSEFRVGKGRLLISTFNSDSDAPEAKWWRYNLARYMTSGEFDPKVEIKVADLETLISKGDEIAVAANTNVALNTNDITMKKK